MCYNLGADESADPFIPSAAIYGAKYKWGNAVAVVTQAEDQTSGVFDWNWEDIYDSDWDMDTQNPCPAGWRVPSIVEWQAVLNNNSIAYSTISNETFTGWASSGSGWATSTYTNYAAAIKIGGALVLPAAGSRSGIVNYRGNTGYYWNSNYNSGGSRGLGLLSFDSHSLGVSYTSVYKISYPIRCVAK
jgi:uncharacterized protein (TIGR02145 family)